MLRIRWRTNNIIFIHEYTLTTQLYVDVSFTRAAPQKTPPIAQARQNVDSALAYDSQHCRVYRIF